MIGRFSIAASTALTAGLLALVSALPAAAQPADTPVSGDERAIAHPGNATTCAEAGLEGDKVSVGFTILNSRFLTITSVPSDVELTGIVVKGGPAYNVYPPDVLTMLHAPLTGSGNIAGISHWFACGKKITTTTAPTTTTESTTTTTESTTTGTPTSDTTTTGSTATSASTVTTTSAPGGGGASGDSDLAQTGFAPSGLLVAGGVLLLAGLALMLGIRRTRGGLRRG